MKINIVEDKKANDINIQFIVFILLSSNEFMTQKPITATLIKVQMINFLFIFLFIM